MSDDSKFDMMVIEQLKRQSDTTEKLADSINNIASKMEKSIERHDQTDERIEVLEVWKEQSDPVIRISRWLQNAAGQWGKNYLVPAIIFGVIAASGIAVFNEYSTTKEHSQSEHSTNGD